jgi:RNA polymerase sigma-70 factor (ECF subfamily)
VIASETHLHRLMLAGLAGDAGAYRQLLAELTGLLRAYFARRAGPGAAEDLVQETLIAIHTKRETYDPQMPLTAWVYGIARYKLIDEFRKTKRRAQVPLEEASDVFVEDSREDLTAKRDVEKLLAKLPEAKRALVRAIKLDGDSVADAAARAGLSEGAAKVSVHRAIKSLGDDVREDRDEDR